MKQKQIFIVKLSILIIMLSGLQTPVFAADPMYGKVHPYGQDINAMNDCIEHNKKGIQFLEKGYPLHAIDEFKLSLMLNPNSAMSATVYNNLGKAYEMIKEYDMAIMSYEHSIKINPDFSKYYKNLVRAYEMKGTLDKARENYEDIAELNPQDAQVQFILGLIYKRQGQNAMAIESFKKFVALEPKRDLAFAARKYVQDLGGSITE